MNNVFCEPIKYIQPNYYSKCFIINAIIFMYSLCLCCHYMGLFRGHNNTLATTKHPLPLQPCNHAPYSCHHTPATITFLIPPHQYNIMVVYHVYQTLHPSTSVIFHSVVMVTEMKMCLTASTLSVSDSLQSAC